jgi:bifunctional NMN adenylyltransferase/nudix hydrolase
VIRAALDRSAYVLVLVGSANASRDTRNPFSFEDRSRMIVESLRELDGVVGDPAHVGLSPAARVIVRPVDDHLYNDAAWIAGVQTQVGDVLTSALPSGRETRAKRVGIIGHAKDRSSYYLRIFPHYEAIDVPAVLDDTGNELASTTIREALFAAVRSGTPFDRTTVPAAVDAHLARLVQTSAFREITDEAAFVDEYRARWSVAPYPPTFTTVDAVVVQAGHVLMVVRGEQPGRGRLALPGGFLAQDETLLESCVRELYEETQLDVPRRVVLGALRDATPRPFDDPHRSARGRTITHAFRFDLNEKTLPKVKGSDDAMRALWVPLAAIRPESCFEDHAFIIRIMLGVA